MWAVGEPTAELAPAPYEGDFVVGTGIDAEHPDGFQYARLVTPQFRVLEDATNPSLRFAQWYQFTDDAPRLVQYRGVVAGPKAVELDRIRSNTPVQVANLDAALAAVDGALRRASPGSSAPCSEAYSSPRRSDMETDHNVASRSSARGSGFMELGTQRSRTPGNISAKPARSQTRGSTAARVWCFWPRTMRLLASAGRSRVTA